MENTKLEIRDLALAGFGLLKSALERAPTSIDELFFLSSALIMAGNTEDGDDLYSGYEALSEEIDAIIERVEEGELEALRDFGPLYSALQGSDGIARALEVYPNDDGLRRFAEHHAEWMRRGEQARRKLQASASSNLAEMAREVGLDCTLH